ncbi:uncharacterized protein BP01DRAFT_412158 [Aspergillus saccharolyticus JOP 1030-1]|uniref:Rhodopsin domain-containing protein n=1 Tax=Aspergillus saccharolyticus JOP 1030-1 TaxID=1450539 RepID=A0A318ZJM7_9EURO|nr:hypothetical protein BP01DRAFT_412158 [Aspergillus saccharolyticus JOP 1030-1]PYH47015.1 hypothetical protein BP01DRAFT_412158 [Aspergillus saccharolyticus JOP 1030-1]
MSSPPPKQYPPGYLDEFCGEKLIILATSFIILELVFAAVRFYVLQMQKRKWGVEDWLMIPALLANLCVCISGIVLIPRAGVGYHIQKVMAEAPWKLVNYQKGIFSGIWVWGLAIASPKLAILNFYLRFFRLRTERILTYGLMLFVGSTYVAVAFAHTFACWPVAYQMHPFPSTKDHCFNLQAFYRWMSFPNILSDVAMLVLPLPMVSRLQMSRYQKIGLGIIFATGGIGLVTSCCRFAISYNNVGQVDNTWMAVPLNMWTEIEPGVYFLAACMPSFPPLLRSLWARFFQPTSSHRFIDDGNNNKIALYSIGGSPRCQDVLSHNPANTRNETHEEFPAYDEEGARRPALSDNMHHGLRHSVAYADLGSLEAARRGSPRTLMYIHPPRNIRITEEITVRHGQGTLWDDI